MLNIQESLGEIRELVDGNLRHSVINDFLEGLFEKMLEELEVTVFVEVFL
jgi:hypothetical protein